MPRLIATYDVFEFGSPPYKTIHLGGLIATYDVFEYELKKTFSKANDD